MPKKTFLNKKELSSYLNQVITSPQFKECLVYARAELMNQHLTAEQLEGAKLFEEVLLNLPIEESDDKPLSPGLNHDLEPRKKQTK